MYLGIERPNSCCHKSVLSRSIPVSLGAEIVGSVVGIV
jgi:hypothetical protein